MAACRCYFIPVIRSSEPRVHPETSCSVSVIGLGPMGGPIAARLLASGFAVDAWNRSSAPAEAFRARGGLVRSSPSELRGSVVLSVLPDIDQLTSVLHGPRGLLAPDRGPIDLVVMSTTSPERVVDLAEGMRDLRATVIDAPMSGGVEGAVAGTLSIMVGGEEPALGRVLPVLETIGSSVEVFGGLGAGSLAKLCNQLVVAGTLVALAEAFDLAERGGLEARKLVTVLRNGLADSAVLRSKADQLVARHYDGGGSARNQLKDLRYAREVSERLGASSPVSRAVLELFERVVADGRGGEDHAVVREFLRDMGAVLERTDPAESDSA